MEVEDTLKVAEYDFIKTLIVEIEIYFSLMCKNNFSDLSFNFCISHSMLQGFDITKFDKGLNYDLGEKHKLFFQDCNRHIENLENLHEIKIFQINNQWHASLHTDFNQIEFEKHSEYVINAIQNRSDWFAEFLDTNDIEVYDLHYQSMPFPIDPIWPSYRFGFFVGYTENYTWLMSNGLSNPVHPSDCKNWKELSSSHNMEILCRLDKGNISTEEGLEKLLKNKFLKAFLGVCGTISLTEPNRFELGHQYIDINFDKYTAIRPIKDNIGCFLSDLQSLHVAKPPIQHTGMYPAIAIKFATLVKKEKLFEEFDFNSALEYSMNLLRKDQIGYLNTEFFQDIKTLTI